MKRILLFVAVALAFVLVAPLAAQDRQNQIESNDKRSSLVIQNDGNAVIYQVFDPANPCPVSRQIGPGPDYCSAWASNTVIPPTPVIPVEPIEPSEGRIRGVLRPVNTTDPSSHYADDVGAVLPVGFTYMGALERRKFHYAEYLAVLDAAVAADYQFARVLFTVGGHPYWNGFEIPPFDMTRADGVRIPGWPDYEAQVLGLGVELAARGLQVFVSSGDLNNVFAEGGGARLQQWSRRVGELLNASGVQVVAVDVNEAWQQWWDGSEPEPSEVFRDAIEPFLEGYGKATIALRSAGPCGELASCFDRWAGDTMQVHGHRGHYQGDHTSVVRHARGWYYDEGGNVELPQNRVCFHSEPGGPADPINSPVMGGMEDPEQLALIAAANWIGDCAYVHHTAAGVRAWLGVQPQDHPGWKEIPAVRSVLPGDLQERFTKIVHGGRSDSPLTDADSFPGANRVDSVLADDGRFVSLVYGEDGYTRLLARVGLSFSIFNPETLEGHQFHLNAGETLDVFYRAGRILSGRVD